MDDFPMLIEELFQLLRISFSEISKPQDLIKNDILQQFDREEYFYVLRDIYKFALINKNYYDKIINEKRGRGVSPPHELSALVDNSQLVTPGKYTK